MWDSFLSIELDGYGFTIDSYWFYLSLSWQIIALSAAAIVAYKVYKWWRVF